MNTTTTDEGVEADEAYAPDALAVEDYHPGEADDEAAVHPGDEEVADEDDDAELGYSRVGEEELPAPGNLPSPEPGWSDSQPMLGVAEVPEPSEDPEDVDFPEASVVPESYDDLAEANGVREVAEMPEGSEVSEAADGSEFPDVAEAVESGHDVHAAMAVDEPLLAPEFSTEMLSHWNEVQVSFVEDPRASVQAAEELVREIQAALVAASTERLSRLAGAWSEGSDTEELRLALRQYRTFIGVLLPR
jgi:hypothetical protein